MALEEIWSEMRRIRRQMNKLIGNFLEEYSEKRVFRDKSAFDYRIARTDFNETDKEFILEIELPGIEKEGIKLEVTDTGIKIRAEKEIEKEEKNEGSYSYLKSDAGFYRSINLPEYADKKNIDASYKNGVLTVRILKRQNIKTTKEVKIK